MAHNTEKLRELLERVEKASGPDRLLDHDILLGLGWSAPPVYHETRANAGVWIDEDDGPDTFVAFAKNPDRYAGFWHTPDGSYAGDELPRLTASLDASIALVERMLPGWGWSVERYGRTCDAAMIKIEAHPDEQDKEWNAVHASAPLAILSALLRALLAKEETSDAR